MEMLPFFKSVLDEDKSAVVICNTDHRILYMNSAACERYSHSGGVSLLGKSLLECHNNQSSQLILQILEWFKADPTHNRVHTFYNDKENKDVYMIALRNDQGELIGYYEKHEYRNRDTAPFYFEGLDQ